MATKYPQPLNTWDQDRVRLEEAKERIRELEAERDAEVYAPVNNARMTVALSVVLALPVVVLERLRAMSEAILLLMPIMWIFILFVAAIREGFRDE